MIKIFSFPKLLPPPELRMMSEVIREQQSMFTAFQEEFPILDEISSTQYPDLDVIQESLKGWLPDRALSDEKIQLIASNILKTLVTSSSELPLMGDLFVEAESIDFGGIKGLCSRTKEGFPVIYLSSKIYKNSEGGVYVNDSVQVSGAFKIISPRLALSRESERIHTSLVALAKPNIKIPVKIPGTEAYSKKVMPGTEEYNKKVKNLENEAIALNRCKDFSGVISLSNLLRYSKGEARKVRMVLPWYDQGDLTCRMKKLTRPESIEVCYQLLEIVAGLESKECIFRDLKPENILVKRNEEGKLEIVLCDTGFMRFSDDSSIPKIAGSWFWVAPEYSYLSVNRKNLLEKKPQEAFRKGEYADLQQAQEQALLDYERKIVELTTSKLDVWPLALICAYLLEPDIWSLLRSGVGGASSPTSPQDLIVGAEWYKLGYIPSLQQFRSDDDFVRLLKEMLHPKPEERLSATDSLKRFCSLFKIERV